MVQMFEILPSGTHSSYIVDILVADALAIQGAWASATMVLTYLSWNIPV